jgi:hypothetical protein
MSCRLAGVSEERAHSIFGTSTLKMKKLNSIETFLNIRQTTRPHTPEDENLGMMMPLSFSKHIISNISDVKVCL